MTKNYGNDLGPDNEFSIMDRIKYLAAQKNICSNDELADLCGVSTRTLQNYLHGGEDNITYRCMKRVCQKLNIPLSALVSDDRRIERAVIERDVWDEEERALIMLLKKELEPAVIMTLRKIRSKAS